MTACEIGNEFRGRMLRSGWTPKQFRERYRDYSLNDVILAVNPKVAYRDTKVERSAPMKMFDENAKFIQGDDIDEDLI